MLFHYFFLVCILNGMIIEQESNKIKRSNWRSLVDIFKTENLTKSNHAQALGLINSLKKQELDQSKYFTS